MIGTLADINAAHRAQFHDWSAQDAKEHPDAAVLPNYRSMSVAILKRRIEILKERGSKRDQEREIPAIKSELRRRGSK